VAGYAVAVKRVTASLAILLALLATPALTGCSSIEQMVEQATGGDVDLPGNTVPDDFPSEVPLAEGEVVMGAAIGNADGKAWNVTIKVPGLDVVDTIKAELEAAGFVATPAGNTSTGESATIVYGNDAYGVVVVVTKDTNDGFLANYTVTDAAQ